MSAGPLVCSQCHAPLEAGAASPSGLCPRCVAAQAVTEAMPALPPSSPITVAPPAPAAPARAEPRRCPYCGTKLMPRESSCPTCKNKVPLPAAAVDPRPRRLVREEVRRPAQEGDEAEVTGDGAKRSLDLVQYGLTCHQYRIQAAVAGLFVLFASFLVAVIFGEFAGVFVLAGGIVGLVLAGPVATLLGVVGSALCLALPVARARVFIGASLALEVVGLAVGVALLLWQVPVPAAAVFGLASWVFLMLFLQRLGAFVGYVDLEDEAKSLLLRGLLLQLAPLALGFLFVAAGWMASLTRSGALFAIGAVGCLLLICALVVALLRFLGDFIKLLERLGEAIRGERGSYVFDDGRAPVEPD
jgi:hypothetical protein